MGRIRAQRPIWTTIELLDGITLIIGRERVGLIYGYDDDGLDVLN